MAKRPGGGDRGPRPGRIALGGGVVVPYPAPKDASASAVGRSNRRKDTKPEVALRRALHRHGLRFRKDYAIRVDDARPIRVDIAFTRARLAVMVDGCFWHGCPQHGTTPKSNTEYWAPKLARNMERDREDDRRLAADGWLVQRIWEHVPLEEAVAATLDALERARET